MGTEKPEPHGSHCERSGIWYKRKECRAFSTDGTGMGARVAHLYGTNDDSVIEKIQEAERRAEIQAKLTGMDEEQRDWECVDDEWYD